MDSRLQIRLLGPPEIKLEGRPIGDALPVKAQAILYYLAATGKAQTRAALAALLWGDLPDDAARGNLRKALAAIREAAGPVLHDESHAVCFDSASGLSCDATEFARLVGADAGAGLAEALSHYSGDFLDGFYVHRAPDFETWMLAERDRLRERYVGALLSLAESQGEQGIATARQVLALESWREEAHRLLMRLLAESGQRSAALAQYEACRRALQEELGVEPGPETVALIEAIRRGQVERREPRPGIEHFLKRSNLPPQPTPFIGRARELAEVLTRLRDPNCRLLALVGPGGIGKSRLALAAAQALLEAEEEPRPFHDGLWFVPLAAAADLSGVLSALSAATGFRFYGEGEPEQQMLNFLREKDALLGLDNFEHLTPEATGSDACLGYLDAILGVAPGVKLLVTSRAAVNLSAAWTYRVDGLTLSPEGAGHDAARDCDAVRLFVQCAGRANAGFSFDADRESALRICRLADGAPLAIEMAAAWLSALPARRIADEIGRGLDILTMRMADKTARHRSMRAVFEHSWELLTEDERGVLSRLSAFRGSFSSEAAEAIAGASLPLLASLVEKSLVQADVDSYYSLHELLRQFAAEKLTQVGQTDVTRDAHGAYYLGHVSAQEASLDGPAQVAALDAIAREIENVREAWRWAVGRADWAAISAALHGLYLWHLARSRLRDGLELSRVAADRLEQDPWGATAGGVLLLRRLRAREADYLAIVGDFDAAESMARACVTHDADSGEAALCLTTLVQIARQRGRPAEAHDLAVRALDLAREAGDIVRAASALGLLCLLETNNFCRYDEAQRYADESLRLARQTGRLDLIAWVLGWTEHLSFVRGAYDDSIAQDREVLAIALSINDLFNYAAARRESRDPRIPPDDPRRAMLIAGYETGLDIFKEIGHRPSYGIYQSHLAQQLLWAGRPDEALAPAQNALAVAEEIGNRDHRAFGLLALGEVEMGLGDLVAARAHLSESLQLSEAIGMRHVTFLALHLLAALLQTEAEQSAPGALGIVAKRVLALELCAFVQADPRAAHTARVRAGWLLDTLVNELPSDVAAAAIARGQARTLEDVVSEMLASGEA